MNNIYSIRLAREEDVDALLTIYAPYVEKTIISFEYEVPSREEFIERIRTFSTDYPYLVCEYNGRIVGYAYASKHRARTAYQWSAESTVYMHKDFHRKGIARVLYETLFDMLRLQGYFNVYAGISIPNDQSVGFHLALGFEEIGIFKNIGFKFGNWHGTHWSQLKLNEYTTTPGIPKKMHEVIGTREFTQMLTTANERVGRL
jgi:L-amino acid N-acyltransferase YncA